GGAGEGLGGCGPRGESGVSEERETLEVDFLFVGAGPASLAGAYHLRNLLQRNGSGGSEVTIAVVEKAAEVRAHSVSGAGLDPRAPGELMPHVLAPGGPLASGVRGEDILFLTANGRFRFPITPPPLRNHGNFVLSIGELTRWLGSRVEEQGTYVLTGTAAVAPLFEDGRIVGVRTGDKGVDRRGDRKPNFEPGADLRARVTVFGEGARGSPQSQLAPRRG